MDRLRSPLPLGIFTVPNRIVMPPMVIWKAAHDGTVTAEVREHYRRSAGAGMVIVEATVVSPEGRLSRKQLGAFDDRHVAGLAELAGIIHSSGAAASLQLHHAGSNTNLENTFGMTLLGPSTVPAAKTVPEALTGQGIERLLGCFAGAARRAAEAASGAPAPSSPRGVS